jgi:hypothetical protein
VAVEAGEDGAGRARGLKGFGATAGGEAMVTMQDEERTPAVAHARYGARARAVLEQLARRGQQTRAQLRIAVAPRVGTLGTLLMLRDDGLVVRLSGSQSEREDRWGITTAGLAVVAELGGKTPAPGDEEGE